MYAYFQIQLFSCERYPLQGSVVLSIETTVPNCITFSIISLVEDWNGWANPRWLNLCAQSWELNQVRTRSGIILVEVSFN